MPRHRLPTRAAAFLLALSPAGSLAAQLPDARVIPPGAFRVSFGPSWTSHDRFFDANGEERLLGSTVSSDSAGADLFPTLSAAQAAVRSLTANPTYRLTLGGLQVSLDADTRRFPFELAVGVSRRVSLWATVPIVVTRTNAALALDSATGNTGWNQALAQSGNATGPAQVSALLAQLDAGAAVITARIAAGDYGCPAGPLCASAQSAVSRAQTLKSNLATLAASSNAAVPLAGSATGTAIAAAIASVSAELVQFGASAVSIALPLPTRRFSAEEVQTVLTDPPLAYAAEGFEYTKISAFGDAEIGLRLGLVQAEPVRLTLTALARLPTGKRDSPHDFIDLAPADRQLDLAVGLESVLAPGSALTLSLAGSYTRQFPAQLERRVAPLDRPITPDAVVLVTRDLGDELRLAAFPGIRLNPGFTVFASAAYYRKGADRYTLAGGPTGPDVSPLGVRSAMQTTSFGGGIHYRSIGRDGARLPVEAGLSYATAYYGSGGYAPKATMLTMYLRWFYRLWGP